MLPWLFVILCAAGLIIFTITFWRSLRAAFGAGDRQDLETEVVSESRRALISAKELLLQDIRELEFERDAGKISDKDFEELNEKLRRRAKDVLVKLDEGVDEYRSQAEAMLTEHIDAAGTRVGKAES